MFGTSQHLYDVRLKIFAAWEEAHEVVQLFFINDQNKTLGWTTKS